MILARTTNCFGTYTGNIPAPLFSGKSSTIQTGLFINNKFQPALDGKTFAVVNPANGKEITHVSEASAKDVDLAVKAARKAYQESWGEKVSVRGLLPRAPPPPRHECLTYSILLTFFFL